MVERADRQGRERRLADSDHLTDQPTPAQPGTDVQHHGQRGPTINPAVSRVSPPSPHLAPRPQLIGGSRLREEIILAPVSLNERNPRRRPSSTARRSTARDARGAPRSSALRPPRSRPGTLSGPDATLNAHFMWFRRGEPGRACGQLHNTVWTAQPSASGAVHRRWMHVNSGSTSCTVVVPALRAVNSHCVHRLHSGYE